MRRSTDEEKELYERWLEGVSIPLYAEEGRQMNVSGDKGTRTYRVVVMTRDIGRIRTTKTTDWDMDELIKRISDDIYIGKTFPFDDCAINMTGASIAWVTDRRIDDDQPIEACHG